MVRWRLVSYLLLAGIAAGSGSSVAEDLDQLALLYGDEESVSIATGTAKPVHLAPAVASVITSDDLRDMGVLTLSQALESVPGLHVSSSFNRLQALFSIRGIHTGQNPQVLLLMNGVPFNELTTGGRPSLFRLPVAAISRVEIVRGPGSAVYGADAFAGVINIITKTGSEMNGTRVGARGGSFGTGNVWFQTGKTGDGWDAGITMEWIKSDGDSGRRVDSDLQSNLDSMFGTSASLAPGALDTRYDVLNTNFHLGMGHWNARLWSWLQRDGGIGPGGAQALDPEGYTDIGMYQAILGYRNTDSAVWDIEGKLSYVYKNSRSHFVLLPPGATVPIGSDGNLFTAGGGMVTFTDGLIGNPRIDDRTANVDFAATYSGITHHRLRFGMGATHQQCDTGEAKNFGAGVIDGSVSPVDGSLTDVSDTGFVFQPDVKRDIRYVSIQDEWRFAPDWELTTGVRFDDFSDVGGTVNPRLALTWATTQRLTSKLLYGRAFRAPSFSELYYINNPSLLGDPDLSPETIDTWELVFDYRGFDWHGSVNLFHYEIKDLIDTVAVGSTFVASNAGSQTGNGFEIEAQWDIDPTLVLRGNYALQRAEDSGQRVADAPGQQLYLDLRWRFLPQWRFSTQLNWVADRKRAAGDARSAIDDYIWVDFNLQHCLSDSPACLSLRLQNVFDVDAREPSNGTIADDYPLEGRALFAGVKVEF